MIFLQDAARWLLGMLDSTIYKLVAIVLQGIFDLAGTEIVTNETIEAFAQRVYVILGILMLFKLTASLINALVNPDMLTDKQRGTDKIVVRVIGMLAMLVFVDDVYKELMIIQEKAIPVLPKLIIGYRITSDDTSDTSNIGDTIAWSMYQGYFTYNPNCPDNEAHMENGTVKDSVKEFVTVGEATEAITAKCPSNSSKYLYDYFWLMPTISGVILVIILLGFAIDVAMRAFKLLILRMLAPIPIISYVDPKSSKDGAFANFIKIFTSTYLSLLLTLGTIYFGIFIINEIIKRQLITQLGATIGYGRASFVWIFLIIGLFFFMKQAPKFIKDILGIKPGPGSVGISGMLAGAAGLVGTRSLWGAAAGFMAGADAASTAAAQGKQAPAGWGVGRDLAAQIRTGDRNAKGGISHRLADFETRRSMRTSAARLGVTRDAITAAKKNMYAQEAAYYDMQRKYEEARLNGASQDQLRRMSEAMDKQRVTYNKSKSWYDKANKIGDQYRVNQTFKEEMASDAKRKRHPWSIHTTWHDDMWSPTVDKSINPDASNPQEKFDKVYDEYTNSLPTQRQQQSSPSQNNSNTSGNSSGQSSNRPPSGPPAGQGRVF